MRRAPTYTRYPRAILWLVRGGRARIGGGGGDSEPAFEVEVPSFYISKQPVSNRQYEAFDGDFRRSAASPGDDDPAAGVSFARASAYCAWYASVSHKPIRLPGEIEWEYAARAGDRRPRFFDDDPEAAAPYLGRPRGHGGDCIPALGRLKPGPNGLVAMLGGVWEWTGSLYRPYPLAVGADPPPGEPGPRVLRGGSFRRPLAELGCHVRRAAAPECADDDVGFRIARSL